MQAYAWFRPALVDWDDVVVLAMPMFHVYGNVGIFASSLIGHLPLAVVPNPRDLSDLLRTIHSTRAAFFPAVPRSSTPCSSTRLSEAERPTSRR
jgi:long-chain acyl-CoA synthetase